MQPSVEDARSEDSTSLFNQVKQDSLSISSQTKQDNLSISSQAKQESATLSDQAKHIDFQLTIGKFLEIVNIDDFLRTYESALTEETKVSDTCVLKYVV